MIIRTKILELLNKRLSNNPAVAILGPRQVGKTTVAKEILKQCQGKYFDLENPNTKRSFENDLEIAFQKAKNELWVIDEVQEIPEIFSILRSVIDENRINGRFLLLGSADPKLVKGVSESLTGRISYNHLHPLHLLELDEEELEKHWLRGGFPIAYTAADNESSQEWLYDYIRSQVERELVLLFDINLNPIIIEQLWSMIAHLNGNLLNSANLARALGIDNKTVNRYLNFLEGAFLIRRLKPWHINAKKRLIKSPKIYISDTGILHTLLGIDSLESLALHPSIGASWESYVFLQISNAILKPFDLYFYRTQNGAEIDLLLVHAITPIASIEVKNSNNPSLSRGFYNAIEDLGTKHNYIITRNRSFVEMKNRKVRSLHDFLSIDLPSLAKTIFA